LTPIPIRVRGECGKKIMGKKRDIKKNSPLTRIPAKEQNHRGKSGKGEDS